MGGWGILPTATTILLAVLVYYAVAYIAIFDISHIDNTSVMSFIITISTINYTTATLLQFYS